MYYKVLRQNYQYYKVLQSTTPVLLWTTKYDASTTLYYKVPLQYYSVLQRTTPVLLCTTQYYNVLLCTTKYYNVLLQYYSVLFCTTKYYTVLQSSTPVPLCPTKCYASTTLYCAAQQESPSNFTKYCACHAK